MKVNGCYIKIKVFTQKYVFFFLSKKVYLMPIWKTLPCYHVQTWYLES